MRFMVGGSLADRIAQDALGLPEVARILAAIAPALDMAHARGVIHRDLKPGNILLDEDDNPYIADFGIAKLAEGGAAFTSTGIVGTPTYMSPEQARGHVALDGRSDVYALGAMLYELLAGQPPYKADTPLSLAMAHVLNPVPHVREVVPNLPIEIDRVVSRAMAKKREQRYATAGSLAAALTAAIQGAALPTSPHAALVRQADQSPTPAGSPQHPQRSLASPTLSVQRSLLRGKAWPVWIASLAVIIVLLVAIAALSANWNHNANGLNTQTVVASMSTSSTPFSRMTAPLKTPTSTTINPSMPTDTSTMRPTATDTSTVTPSQEPTATRQDTPTATPSSTATMQPSVTPAPRPTKQLIPLEWLSIPSGSFVMGSTEGEIQQALAECQTTEGQATGRVCEQSWFNEPQLAADIASFQLTKYEITNAQYATCVQAQKCQSAGRRIADNNLPYNPVYSSDDYPVVGVNWHDADSFCRSVGGRLPTEAEWEWAARGSDRRRYPWGNSYDPPMANLGSGHPSRVGSFPNGVSPFGVMDMAGNVFEWTSTSVDQRYILRGGGWSKYYFRGRTTDRGTQLDPSFANYDIGFRCAR